MQRLTPEEEEAIVKYILQLQAWGWPARVEQVRSMATELLLHKEDSEPIGINWPQKLLSRHPEIRTAYIPPLDKERAFAQDPEILDAWFELFDNLKKKYGVELEDIWNMDEKGFMQGVIAKLKAMIAKYELTKEGL